MEFGQGQRYLVPGRFDLGDTSGNGSEYFLKKKNAWTDSHHVINTSGGRVDPKFTEYKLLSTVDYSPKPLTTSITIVNGNGTSVNNKDLTIQGKTYQFSASAKPSGAGQDLVWKTSNTSIATVTRTGKVTFKKYGTVKVTVRPRDGSGKSAYFYFSSAPNATSISIKNQNGAVINGKDLVSAKNPYQFSASAAPAAAMQKFNWSTSNTSIATVDSTGKVTFTKTGKVKITVSAKDKSGLSESFTFTLKPMVTSVSIKNAVGNVISGKDVSSVKNPYQLSASASPAAAIQKFSWSVSDTSIATIDSTGKVTFKKPGTVKITAKATDGSGKTAYTNFTYCLNTKSISIKNQSGTVINGKDVFSLKSPYQLRASASPAAAMQNFTWSVSNTSIAKVDSTGKVIFTEPGTVKITAKAKDGTGISAYCNFTYAVETESITIKNVPGYSVNDRTVTTTKSSYQFSADALPETAWQIFNWSTDNTSIATVDATGKVTFKQPGTVKVTAKAKDGTGVSASFNLIYQP